MTVELKQKLLMVTQRFGLLYLVDIKEGLFQQPVRHIPIVALACAR